MYSFSIFNRAGTCIFYLKGGENSNLSISRKDEDEARKLVFGMTFSLRNLCGKLSPDGSENLQVLRTNNFAIHHFMSASGLVFILFTDASCPNQYTRLKAVYAGLYTEYVSKNILFEGQNVSIESPVFHKKCSEFFGVTSATPGTPINKAQV
jgi:hypothetical protein